MKSTHLFIASGALALGFGLPASAQTGAPNTQNPPAKSNPPTQTGVPSDTTRPGMDKDKHATGMKHSMATTPALASKVIGTEIVDAAGQSIGEIKDLYVCDSGDVIAVVEREDDAQVGVPLGSLQAHLDADDSRTTGTDGRTTGTEGRTTGTDGSTIGSTAASAATSDVQNFTLRGERSLFDAAPQVTDAKLIDHAWLTRSLDHYAGRKTAKVTDPSKPTTTTGRDGTVASGKPMCVKTLIGEDVKGTDGDGIGDVKDLAIDLGNSQVAYAIVSSGGLLGMGDSLHAVPFDRLTLSDGSVTIPMTKDGVNALPKLDMDRLPAHAASTGSTLGDPSKDRMKDGSTDRSTDRKDG